MFTGLLRGQFKISMAAVGRHSGAAVSIAFQQEGCGFNPLCRGLFLCRVCMFFLRWCEFSFKESHSTQVKDVHVRQICNSGRCVAAWMVCLSPCCLWSRNKVLTCPGCDLPPPKDSRDGGQHPCDPRVRENDHGKWTNGCSWMSKQCEQTVQKLANQHASIFARIHGTSFSHVFCKIHWILHFATHLQSLVYHCCQLVPHKYF